MTDDADWYRGAIIYELHVRAFHDSTGDGVGDFRGLAEKLDYLKELGVSALWLLPFYPSPLRDDGYDIADYTGVNPAYGTLADFKYFLREAHRRGLKVITELVLNHTSDQHPWFQRARRAPPGSPWRDFYVWSDSPHRYKDARIIFKDFESSNWTWDPVAGAYYWHRFYHHQPDLNWESTAVRKAMVRALDFWLEMGVDGLRLDAVPYLHEREGTSCENLPETHAALKALRRHVDRKFKSRMLLAEANQWPEDAVSYFGEGDESHMNFHFPLMPRMFMSVRVEDRYPIIDILAQTPPIPSTCQWALFLRNHDELTLEMVTDEERDYMYRVYAHDPQARINLGIRRRLAPLLQNDRRTIELMTGLLFSLPGTPVLYYGDEIGMGDNIFLGDRHGVRTPMQWSADRNAGFSRANPQRLYLPVIIDPDFSYETLNVDAQEGNPHSLLRWMKRLIALRQRFRAFGRGSLEFIYPSNRKVLAFVRRWEREQVLVVANLSRHAQFVELDLSSMRDHVPVEMFGGTDFPRLGERPYLLTLGPHSFYWFEMRSPREAVEAAGGAGQAELPRIQTEARWADLFREGSPQAIEDALPRFLSSRRWFPSGRRLKSTEVVDAVPVAWGEEMAYLTLVRVESVEGDPEVFVLPLAFAAGERAGQVLTDHPQHLLARLSAGGEEGIVYCALRDRGFAPALQQAIGRRRRFKGAAGELIGIPSPAYRKLRGDDEALPPSPRGESTILYGDRLVLELCRRLEAGPNPDVEVGTFLTETAAFPHAPPVAGRLEYRPSQGESATVAVLKGFVANEGDAWQLSLDSASRALEQVLAERSRWGEAPLPSQPLTEVSAGTVPPAAEALVGTFLETARRLGERTGELHLALASRPEDPAFAPEPFTPFYQRSLYQSVRNLAQGALDGLSQQLPRLPREARAEAERLLGRQEEILKRARAVLDRRITAQRTRVHGDLHLGHVFWTGRDFVIMEFTGDPDRPLSTRRLKRSPLRDAACLIRSLHGAAYRALAGQAERSGMPPEASTTLEPWAHAWALWSSSAFLRAYVRTVEPSPLLPSRREDLAGLLFVRLLEKALEDLGDELKQQPDAVRVWLHGINRLLDNER
jgi:maltose alpha-D-glucosyltransferase/alpha-amylase